ncbi:ABC transporter permease subunit [Elioraea sp. Yellowstone]|uniref:ABC transporter permease n=1 Tax=Elioraea sp. Yellowstone TaxID=2592070 RepID=UPI001151CC53|nr:ABC transporter permease subunit [Elioraea sp. Yellowstone]TQF84501.1 ABC transporter permease subunit [Elioraea sp. Yellowstone]
MSDRVAVAALVSPALAFLLAFFLLPLLLMARAGAEGPEGVATYVAIATDTRYLASLARTVGLAAATTVATLLISTVAGVFLARNRFPGRRLLTALLTLPLAFPGVVVGFMVILLAGRQGVIGTATAALWGERMVFAYSFAGLFVGYLYFSIPRTVLTVMAAAEKLDPALEEAARSCGAARWQVVRDVILPGLKGALLAAGAICFATAMGAFGTAFTLATDIDVLPMVIYAEFTLGANIAAAAALSFLLGAITWIILAVARTAAGATVAAAG